MIQKEKEKRRFIVSSSRLMIIALSGLMLGGCIYTWIAGVFAGNQLPMPFGFGAGVVLSGSMEPEMGINDLIIVCQSDAYAVGDVVVYQSGRMPVVHRIVSLDEKTVVTKGDANNATDEPISPSDISGKVIGCLPGAGLVVEFMQSWPGMLLVIGAALLLLEMSFQRERSRGERELEEIRAEIKRLSEQQNQNSDVDQV